MKCVIPIIKVKFILYDILRCWLFFRLGKDKEIFAIRSPESTDVPRRRGGANNQSGIQRQLRHVQNLNFSHIPVLSRAVCFFFISTFSLEYLQYFRVSVLSCDNKKF